MHKLYIDIFRTKRFPLDDACSNHAGVATHNLLQFKFSTFILNKILYKLNDLLNI